MRTGSNLVYAAIASGVASFLLSAPANALSMQECGAKYQAAKSAGTLGDKKWNDFRKTECSADATPGVDHDYDHRCATGPPCAGSRSKICRGQTSPDSQAHRAGGIGFCGISKRGRSKICIPEPPSRPVAYVRRSIQGQ